MELKYKVDNLKYKNIKDVCKNYFEISDRLLTKLKKNQKIFLNNSSAYINTMLSLNDTIIINLDFEEESENIVPTKMDLNILYEDDYLIIINKPSGIPIHPSISHFKNSLSNGLKYYFNKINLKKKIRPVNRLDKDTSGIVIFAKHEYIQECLIKQMKNNKFKKEYLAILEGYMNKTAGTINLPISRKEGSIIEREINRNGEKAITHFKLIDNFSVDNQELSLVKFILETGRTHQIRVHSKYINHPILGDSLYGNKSDLINRQALHACKVSFIHPITNEPINIEIPLPLDIKKVLDNKKNIC